MGSLTATLAVSVDFVLAFTFALDLANTATIVIAALALALALAFTFTFAIAVKTFVRNCFDIVAALGEYTLLRCFPSRFAVADDRIGASEPIPIANVGAIEHGSAANEALVAGRFLHMAIERCSGGSACHAGSGFVQVSALQF